MPDVMEVAEQPVIEKTKLNIGCNIYIDRIPIKCDINPCDILISESQERMLIVASKSKIDSAFQLPLGRPRVSLLGLLGGVLLGVCVAIGARRRACGPGEGSEGLDRQAGRDTETAR